MGSTCLHLLPLPVVFPPLPPSGPCLAFGNVGLLGEGCGEASPCHFARPPPPTQPQTVLLRLQLDRGGLRALDAGGAGQGCVTKRAQREPCCGWPLPPHTHLLRCGHTGAPSGHDGFLQGHGRSIGAKLFLLVPPTEVLGWTEGLGRGFPLGLGGWRDEGWAWLSCTVYIGIYLM